MSRAERLLREIGEVVEDPELPLRAKVVLRGAALLLSDSIAASDIIRDILRHDTVPDRAEAVLQELSHVLDHRAQWPSDQN